MSGNDKSFKQLTNYSYLKNLNSGASGFATQASKKYRVLPDDIVDQVVQFQTNSVFAEFGGGKTGGKNLKFIYDSILSNIETDATNKWHNNDKIFNALQSFYNTYNIINTSIRMSKEAKKSGFKGLSSGEAYKDIDINKIKKYLDIAKAKRKQK